MGLQLNVKVNWQQLEKIPLQNKVAGLLAVCALIGGLFFYFVYLPKDKELKGLNGRLARAERVYNEKKAIADNLQTFQEEVRRLNEKLDIALAKLPNTAEIDKILMDMPTLAKEEELVVGSFRPGKETPRGFYAAVPLSLELSGPYNRLAKFFEKVAKLNRIISVKDVRLSSSGKTSGQNVLLKATVAAETYTFIDTPQPASNTPVRR
jgi:type IV pilus assembly protein PilO